jgi:hypothetical protein
MIVGTTRKGARSEMSLSTGSLRAWWTGMAVACAVAAVACSETTVETGGGPLSIELIVTPTTQTLGDSVVVRTSAQGTALAGTILDYGDGQVDSIPGANASTQGAVRGYTYQAVGTYTITATVEDVVQGSRSAQATVEIVLP